MSRRDRGRDATTPGEIPARGWKDVLTRTLAEAKDDHLTLLAAGVAFFGLLALVPGLFALVSVYGLVADPADVAEHVRDLLGTAPAEVRDFIEQQLEQLTGTHQGAAGVGAVVGVVVALWSASSGMKHLIDALNAAYDEDEGRTFVEVRGLALLLTVGAMGFIAGAAVVITIVPEIVDGPIALLRWPVLGLSFVGALAVLYRYAPSRDEPEWRWTTPGALAATAVWLVASGLFSLYVGSFGSYNETYGTLGGVVVVMLWLFLTAAVVLLGAELDAELERQTTYDTTEGVDRPMGARGARAADTLGPSAEQVREERRLTKERANR